jgi:hypothetical protein
VLAEITDEGRAVVKEATDALVSAEFALSTLDDSLVDRLADSLRQARQ